MGDSSATAVATEKGQRFSRERGFVTFVTCMSKQSGVFGPPQCVCAVFVTAASTP
jgi:hypothetical protein